MISGILASPGIAIGKAFLLQNEPIIINKKKITYSNINHEIKKLFQAKKKTITQLKNIKDQTKKQISKKESTIFEGHIMILEDIELEHEIISSIKNHFHTAAYAIKLIFEKQISKIEKIKNEYLKNRAIDIKDISSRLLTNILNIKTINLKKIQNEVILIANDLTPSETAQINFKYIKGFITNLGGETSHTSIMARSLEIPAIVGTGNITEKVKNGDYIILDGIKNRIFINPIQEKINSFQKKKKILSKKKNQLKKFIKLPAITKDNYQFEVSANVSNIQDIINAKKYGATSIGLYRTEFLFMERTELPSEDEQFFAYQKAATIMKNHPIIIRTMDIGGDKEIPYMNFPKEENPFLGWRAIRIGMKKKNILHTQIKAILRASKFGNLKILFPMIISVEEIQTLKEEIKKIKFILKKQKILFDEKIQIGIMIETPASAIIAKHLIQEVDFFSIGTNDLTQYTLAVDRGNKLISHLYNPMSPPILKLIHHVIQVSQNAGKWTGMCGELAGNEIATILLVGMGLNEFSMHPSCIPKIKKVIRSIEFHQAKILAAEILKQNTSNKIMEIIKKNNLSI
ncbi:phosphoenolpyruvate-protein phosphotransferase PtsI [Buchnera aphidicola]|uniref:phosphoenolpyruvate-protein phosphotransferase PtsI n=1 Tax=Buchnera aphidicola TaxID=9 RepID=UPI0031B88A6A